MEPPNPAWLSYVVTSKARAHIRSFLKNQKLNESAKLGGRLLEQALKDLGTDPSQLTEKSRQVLLKSLKLLNWDQLLGEIGLGNRLAAVVARQLVPEAPKAEPGRSIVSSDCSSAGRRATRRRRSPSAAPRAWW